MVIMLMFIGLKQSTGQWNYNGTHIFNTNSGNVGIGNNSPSTLLYVAKNMTEPQIAVRNMGGVGGATYSMIDDASGANWKFKATNTGGFKIRDQAHALDVLTIEANSAANTMYINEYGFLGLGTNTPSQKLEVNGYVNLRNMMDYSFITYDLNGTLWPGGNCGMNFRVDGNDKAWIYYSNQNNVLRLNADPTGWRNDIAISGTTGHVGINTFNEPAAVLDVYMDMSTWARLGYDDVTPHMFEHMQINAIVDNQTALHAYLNRDNENDGTDYMINNTNSAIKGNTEFGDRYSFGVSGYIVDDYIRCGGVLGSYSYVPGLWGALAYKASNSSSYGGYFVSYTTGSGKSGRSSAQTGIGLGAWGDLFGADIHGKVYGAYIEGENYAQFSNGPVYKNDIDVHLQDNGNGTNTVLYTNVSTDVTVQTSGTAILSSGKAAITFDPAFAAALSQDEPVVVTVTPLGESNGVYLSDVTGAGFSVVENNSGKSNITVNYIAIGKRAGYEKPQLAKEVIDGNYVSKIAAGITPDADTQIDGQGLYYENGQLNVGVHPSTKPDPSVHQTTKPEDIRSVSKPVGDPLHAPGTGLNK